MKGIIPSATLFAILLSLSLDSFSQDRFSDGFKAGYKEGFCYEKQNCVAPPPPPRPTLNVGERPESYQDGYNRGFKTGLDAQKGNTKSGYKTAGADPIDYAYKPNQIDVRQAVADNRNEIFDKIMEKAQEYYDSGKYTKCINACSDATSITKLVSSSCYTLIAKSYEALGKKNKARKFYKKAAKL